jgi:hypothetical protein
MAEDDFAKALDDGWIVDFETANKGGNPDPFAGWNNAPHEKAEAYLYRQAGGTYATREMKAEPKPTAPKPPAPAESDDDESQPAKARPGRPRKS